MVKVLSTTLRDTITTTVTIVRKISSQQYTTEGSTCGNSAGSNNHFRTIGHIR